MQDTHAHWVLEGLIALGIAAAIIGGPIAEAAQETTTGSIAGRVVDQQNLAVPGATVTVVSPQGPKTFTTDDDGRFYAPFLTPGSYEIKVDMQGFTPVDRKNVDVRLGQRVDLTLSLQLGGLTEAVTVSQPTPVVDVSKTTVSTTFDSELL